MSNCMKKIILIIIAVLLCGCTKQFLNDTELNEIIKKDNYIIIDVRTKEEYDELHVKDSINIPYDEITKETDIDKNKIILVYCRSGKRSNMAYQTLNSLGYEVYDLGSIDNIKLEKE